MAAPMSGPGAPGRGPGGLAGRLRGLTRNRPAMLGLAGAAGLGVLALARGGGGARPGAASEPATQETAEAAASSAGGGQGAFPNTYATDLAAAVGDLDSRYAEQLAGFSSATAASAASLAALGRKQAALEAKVATATRPAPKPAKNKPAKKVTTRKEQSITVRRRRKPAPARRPGLTAEATRPAPKPKKPARKKVTALKEQSITVRKRRPRR